MSLLPARRALAAGIALVLAINGIAIVGVVRNRADVETRFDLGADDVSEFPYRRQLEGNELASRDLALHVRVPSGANGLSDDQVRAIGLDPARIGCGSIDREHEVFVALELDGPAATNERKLEDARQLARPATSVPVDHGRLFAIDFDRDARSLRTRHPDGRAVAIGRGIVREAPWCRNESLAPAYRVVFSRLSRTSVHVPYRLAHGTPLDAFDRGHLWRARIAFGADHEAFVESIDAP